MTDSMADKMAPTLRREADLRELRQLVARLWGKIEEQHWEVCDAFLRGVNQVQAKEHKGGTA